MVLSMCELYLFSLPAMMIIQSRNQEVCRRVVVADIGWYPVLCAANVRLAVPKPGAAGPPID